MKYAFEIKTIVMVEAESEDEAWEKVQDTTRQGVSEFIFERSPEDDLMNEPNIVIEYTEDECTNYMYFHADSEEHAIEQFHEFFSGYQAKIVLVHCGYIVG